VRLPIRVKREERAGLRVSILLSVPRKIMRIDEGNDSDPRGRGGGRIETSLCNSPRQHSRLLPGLQLGKKFQGTKILPMIGFATLSIGTEGLLRRNR
jgi:hypothetical protein